MFVRRAVGTTVVAVGAALALVAGAAPASAAPVTVARWHMDETSGSTMRDSVGSNNGTLHSVTLGRTGWSVNAWSTLQRYDSGRTASRARGKVE